MDGQGVLDLDAMFGGRPVVLEIGFGMGEATARMAADDPGTGILAVDVHTPGQGNLLGLADRLGLDNVRAANGDAIILLRDAGPRVPGRPARLLPDPWPKTRHHKRRLIQPDFLSLAAPVSPPAPSCTAPPTREPYTERMHDVLSAHPAFENTVELPGPAVVGTGTAWCGTDTRRVRRSGRAPGSRGRAWARGTSSTTSSSARWRSRPRADSPGRRPRVTRWTGMDGAGGAGEKSS
ncbi:tRNA (guanine(46)-N(7))-methyltransferase TrmB [Streptomyces albidoflavus]